MDDADGTDIDQETMSIPNDHTWNDTDGDGYGDNANGSRADLFPNDSSEWYDADGDGVGDNAMISQTMEPNGTTPTVTDTETMLTGSRQTSTSTIHSMERSRR